MMKWFIFKDFWGDEFEADRKTENSSGKPNNSKERSSECQKDT